jgi:hypothetical protein
MRRATIAVALVIAVGSARADDADLDAARKAVESSDYLAARSSLQAALAEGSASPDELAEIYKLTGIVEGALGNTVAAKNAFARWLALDPKGALPAGTSPKITRPFNAAATATAPVKVKTETSADPPEVTLVVVSDRELLIATARVYVRADGGPEYEVDGSSHERNRNAQDRITMPLPHGHRLDLRVQALDRHGNRVVELGSNEVPIVITGATPEPTTTGPVAHQPVAHPPRPIEPPKQRPVVLQWWLWGSVAVAFAGAGTYFGVVARSNKNELETIEANSSQHDFDDATSLATRIRHQLLAFNVGMAAGGAFAIGAAILFATRPHYEQHVAIVPTVGGGSVVIGGAF